MILMMKSHVICEFIRFRWVACQLDYLGDCVTDAERRKALTELPPDLPQTYRRLLERVNTCRPRVKSLVQMCLQFIAFADPPLTIHQLQEAVSSPDTVGVLLDSSNLISADEIAKRCSSLIRRSKDDKCFEFSHFSVQEFLTDANLLKSSALEMYYLTESHSYTLLAMQCLSFLQLKNFDRHLQPVLSKPHAVHMEERNLEHPFYEYAAVLWPKFARGHLDDHALFSLATSLFQRPKSAHFLAWTVHFVSHFLGISLGEFQSFAPLSNVSIRHVTDDCFSPLHMAAILNIPQVCQFLLNDKSDLNHISAWGSPLELATGSLCKLERMDEMEFNASVDSGWCELLQLDSDTALKDRIATMELLISAGATVTNSSQLKSSLLDLSFLFAAVSYDISASTKIMSFGMEISLISLRYFLQCMTAWESLVGNKKCPSSKMARMKETLRDFLNYLVSTPMYSTEVGHKIASLASSTISRLSSKLVSEPGLISSNSAYVKEILRAEVISAVLRDDSEILQDCLIHENCDISGTFYPFAVKLDYRLFKRRIAAPNNSVSADKLDYGCSLLHIAASSNSASAVQILIKLGCDLNTQDSNGELPLHLCIDHHDFSTLNLFLEQGAHHLATDSSGASIWHKCLRDHKYSVIMTRLLELDQNQTAEAMLARTSSGETPILLALKQPRQRRTIISVLAIIDHFSGQPQFWKTHGPVFATAAGFGSQIVIKRLLQAGAEPDPIGDDNFTPLHELGYGADPECAQILFGLYPDAHKLRFQGLTPLEKYIEKVYKFGKKAEPALFTILATPEALSFQNIDGGTVWSFCCREILIRSFELDDHFGNLRLIPFDDVIQSLVRLGALTLYERTKRQSGILPLFSAFGREVKQTKVRTTQISCETLSSIILESRYWDDAKRSPAAVSFLKQAVKDGYLEAVKLLLEHGVSVHQRVDQISPLEFAVSNFSIAIESRTPDVATSKEIMIALFSHAAAEEMKAYSPHGLGLGLMHMVGETNPYDKAHICWLLKELIGWGVDLHREARFKPGCLPLAHHLRCGSYETAPLLLELGANPSMNGDFDPVHDSLVPRGRSFLIRLLQHSRETGALVQWNRILTYTGIEEDGKSTVGVTPLHMIAYLGLNEILDFYIDEGLLENFNATTADGHTAVHFAAVRDQAAIIKQLHTQGASLNAQSHDGSTALHLAVRTQSLSAAKILLELGLKSSLDAIAGTPRMYARALRHENMIELLDRHLRPGVGPSNFAHAHSISWQRQKYLARAFENAIEKDDLGECRRLYRVGCSLDTSMPSCHGCSPLIKALCLERLRIVEWLLHREATTLKAFCDHYGGASAIECAISRPSLNPILKRLVTLYVEQGGDILSNDHSPVGWAIMSYNEEGLTLYLKSIKELTERNR